MDQISRIGMDTSKHVFQLHQGECRLSADPAQEATAQGNGDVLPEACTDGHRDRSLWCQPSFGRLLQSFGHTVKLIASQLVKPYVKRSKNDAADAEALCEAIGVRDRLIRNRTQLANSTRGYAAEFGLTSAEREWPIWFRCSSAFKPTRPCPPWLGSCSPARPRNTRNYRRKSTRSRPSLRPGIGPMNAAVVLPRHRASDRSGRCCSE